MIVVANDYKDIQILEDEELERFKEEEERRKEEAWPPVRDYAHEHAMHELEESLKIGPSVDSIIFFWGPLLFIILIAIALGGA